ncbi:hypothetical protein L6452_06915 [Arctium lappa]|uniref:Uncharacterized protein n=1 Tax=Arctium lappa TaxID=4217 RepID=A0ACB9EJZ4_ARCLA|nr:hypothetical protein L6452_06915 [Arctium lappa]
MDIWMVAVAAGASYIAQHFKKIKQAGGQVTSIEGSFSVKPDSPKPPPDKKCPFRRLAKRESLRKDDSEVRSEVSRGVSSPATASTSDFDCEKGVILGNCEGSSVFSASSLFPGFIGSDGDIEGVRVSERMGDLSCKSSTPRSRMLLRSRRAIRPLSSLENCVMAQLYTEHVEMKEYMSSLFASPSMQTVRPFLVTDGSKVINRASGDAFIVQNNTVRKKLQIYSEENSSFSQVPLPPNISSLEIGGKDEADTNNATTVTMKHFNLPRGSSDATLLLCLGMSFGIISSFLANRKEVEKVNGLLKQKESLVQDLEEELEMKDSLIMQELTIEDHKPQRMDGGSSNDGSPHSVSHERDWEQSTNRNNGNTIIQKAKDDSFSKIEAELEAELEMLELSMTSSTLERRISNLVEVDPDFEPDIVEGELRGEMLDTETNTDHDGTSTTHSANYTVSPRELSLRLHEVLQSQLEERIRELEAEIKSKDQKYWKDLSSSDENNHPVDEEAVVLNLSGEALDAYNEACNEFAKFDDSDEEEEGTPAIHHQREREREREREEDDDDENENENDFEEDEMEKLLIKHIVEKARQGSAVVLNAQRALFSE